jgi:hypothetical protein
MDENTALVIIGGTAQASLCIICGLALFFKTRKRGS